MKRGGEPDPDCPDDAESMRFWCTVGSSYQDQEKCKVGVKSSADIKTNADMVGGLLGSDGVGMGDGAVQAAVAAGGGPSLTALVGVMDSAGANMDSRPAAKGKAKAKAKSGVKKEAKTPEEQRLAASSLAGLRKNALFLGHCPLWR